jgi:serine/threonine-protein kinase RsbW
VASSSTAGTIRLHIPASTAYLALARAATASFCARQNLSLEQLDDVTLAVDEAVGLMLSDATPGSRIECSWTPTDGGAVIAITARTRSGRPPRTTTFAWAVLSALVDSAAADINSGVASIVLTVRHDAAISDSQPGQQPDQQPDQGSHSVLR